MTPQARRVFGFQNPADRPRDLQAFQTANFGIVSAIQSGNRPTFNEKLAVLLDPQTGQLKSQVTHYVRQQALVLGVNATGDTYLHLAAKHKRIDMFEALLRAGFVTDLDTPNLRDQIPSRYPDERLQGLVKKYRPQTPAVVQVVVQPSGQ